MNLNVPSVSVLVNQIKRNLEASFRNVTVVGEITNLSYSSSGHWYLSLSDPESLISAAVFKMDAMRNPVLKNLKDGDKVICAGAISVYAKRGTFQLIIKRITPVGKGDLKEQFELLKKKLAAEGLFDLESKMPIPEMPKRIAVITAKGAAALQDFLNIVDRRSLFCDVLISPALVQGDAAPVSIRKALEKVIRYDMKHREAGNLDKCIDVIVLTRGGGSLEDLWAFNDEALAWDIYNCPIPTISAVGHQVDFSISDFVADLRAETPSAAAEILTNKQKEIVERLENNKRHLKSAIQSKVQKHRYELSSATPAKILEKLWKRISLFKSRLENCNVLKRKVELLSLSESQYELDILINSMMTNIKKLIEKKSRDLQLQNELLTALNPKSILSRGYAYTEIDGKVLTSFKDFTKVEKDKVLKLHFNDGCGEVKKI
ncbi:exodeoxyribonuclease VII large subunit [Bacteriovorax sp. Seq25_V]|uniref:exodeoxyribonuclease VII large subunit n=1 Tax=Bacteriovorax sp. Seq25_V TaxID=1201288 RepID=UPI00038A02E6|nr:exodeoxyribonuclease VII large subunit [Bacteriovorax sp. Seq25_V]EQC45308.1 exodeoxyribonuclease VII, large subunit [Bacteriovorax sp. Seq25_V]